MKTYINGQFVEADQAKLTITDAGLVHGVGLFETMRSMNGRVFRLREHMDRIIISAKQLGLTDQLRAQPLCDVVERSIAVNELSEARIKLTITGGDLSLLAAARQPEQASKPQPSVIVTCEPPTAYPERVYADGITLMIASAKANPFDPNAGHKTLNYWTRLRSLAEAASVGAGEALWLTVTNHLCSGAVSNIFLVKNNTLLTPIARGEEKQGAIPSTTLPGITRGAIIDAATDLGIEVKRKMLSIDDLLAADEVMMRNSSWLMIPVTRVEQQEISNAQPGPIYDQLAQQLFKMIDADEL